ncbi:MAG: hypothetical protein H7Y43_01825, partial [Akkermansiaceae bacterium]|nr:hypothetical protein [Verrucomicrobiales bacterium]
TQDALAWALAAAGRWSDAVAPMRLALAEGTRDARLFLHAGIIASRTGDTAKAEHYFTGAHSLSQTLLPSEQAQLEKYSLRSATRPTAGTAVPEADFKTLSPEPQGTFKHPPAVTTQNQNTGVSSL